MWSPTLIPPFSNPTIGPGEISYGGQKGIVFGVSCADCQHRIY